MSVGWDEAERGHFIPRDPSVRQTNSEWSEWVGGGNTGVLTSAFTIIDVDVNTEQFVKTLLLAL